MNEFYNLILKSVYLVSLSYKIKVYKHYISHIRNFDGGRIEGLVPMKSKPFEKFSKNQLYNIAVYFNWKEGFNKFRLINKKFYDCFELLMI
jgi:hypothetical protein